MQAPQLINIVLKPFEVLTRSFLWRGGKGPEMPGAQQALPAQPQRHEGPSAAAPEPQQPQGQARSREVCSRPESGLRPAERRNSRLCGLCRGRGRRGSPATRSRSRQPGRKPWPRPTMRCRSTTARTRRATWTPSTLATWRRWWRPSWSRLMQTTCWT